MSTKRLEIEYKYRADEIDLVDFVALCDTNSVVDTIQASGFDRFYESSADPDAFCRHRKEPGKFNQLSFKRKTSDRNNYIRKEHNISLGLDVTDDQVQALCAEFGYSYNSSLFKNCFIYKYPRHTMVYYICYDTSLKELGRFIEIEMDEEHEWGSEENALKHLADLEASLKPLGVTPQARVRRSLFEMFRADK